MSRGSGPVAFGTRPEVLSYELGRLHRVEVADDRDRRVLGHIEGLVKLADVRDRCRLEICHAPDGRVFVRVRRKRLLVDDLVQPAVRLILDAHPAFFLDHLTLAPERGFVHAQRGHPIRFEPQRQREVLGRQGLPEHRLVFCGVGVAAPADARDDGRVRLRLDVLRALEHHVLKQMGEAGAAGPLVLRADVIPHRDVHDWRGMVLRQDHLEAVRENRQVVLQLGRTHGRMNGRYRSVRADQQRQEKRPTLPQGHAHLPIIDERRGRPAGFLLTAVAAGELREPRFERFQTALQFRQSAEDRGCLPPFLGADGRVARHHRSRLERVGNP